MKTDRIVRAYTAITSVVLGQPTLQCGSGGNATESTSEGGASSVGGFGGAITTVGVTTVGGSRTSEKTATGGALYSAGAYVNVNMGGTLYGAGVGVNVNMGGTLYGAGAYVNVNMGGTPIIDNAANAFGAAIFFTSNDASNLGSLTIHDSRITGNVHGYDY
jgi:hypothetical protein